MEEYELAEYALGFIRHDVAEVSVTVVTAGKFMIDSYTHPTEAMTNIEYPLVITGKVVDGSVINPIIVYLHAPDSPAEKLILVKTDGTEIELGRGQSAYVQFKGTYGKDTKLDTSKEWRGVKFPSAGSYKIRIETGVYI